MDVNRLRTGEKIAAAAGLALLLIMFIFSWFGVEDFPEGANAWESFSFIDIILFLTVLAAVGLALMSATRSTVSLPVAMSAIVTALGILSVLLILFRIISPPDFGVDAAFGDLGVGIESTREIGVFLGLIAAAALAYGGWRAMQEEGTSFSGEADRLGDRSGGPGGGSSGTTPGTGTTTGTGTGTTGTTEGTTTPGSQPPPPPPPPGGPTV